jgi:preprotein translocase subunit YajC
MKSLLGTGWAAQQPAPPGPGIDPSFMLMIATIFAIFYFLVLRPQQKKQRTLEESVKSAAKGDQIVTSGGLHGKIVSTEEDVVSVEIATLKGGQSVRVQVSRSGIAGVTSKLAPEAKKEGSDS